MSSSLRILGALVVVGLSVFGLLAVFGVIPADSVPQSAGHLALGTGVLLAAILGFKLLSAGRPDLDKTEPPPQL